MGRLALLAFVSFSISVPLACSDDAKTGESRTDGGGGGGSSGQVVASSSGSGGAGVEGWAPAGDAASDAAAAGYVGAHGALRVVGNEIHDEAGQPVQLRGMSLFWSQWSAPFYNADVVHTLATDWRATVVRAAIAVESGGYLEHPEDEMARLETVVEAAIAENVYVIVDWHDHHADQHVAEAQTFFAAASARWGNVPNVLFEIWNEPEAVPWSTVKAYAETTLTTIRDAGASNLVIVGSPDWSTDAYVAADDPVDDDNVAYTFHFYAASHKQTYRDDAKKALDKGVALFVTEWGTCESSGNGTVDQEESQRWLDFMRDHHVGWANWSLFDKDESCAALVPGSSTTGAWNDASLTTSGRFVKSKIP